MANIEDEIFIPVDITPLVSYAVLLHFDILPTTKVMACKSLLYAKGSELVLTHLQMDKSKLTNKIDTIAKSLEVKPPCHFFDRRVDSFRVTMTQPNDEPKVMQFNKTEDETFTCHEDSGLTAVVYWLDSQWQFVDVKYNVEGSPQFVYNASNKCWRSLTRGNPCELVHTQIGDQRGQFDVDNIYKCFLKKLLSFVEHLDEKEILFSEQNEVVDLAKLFDVKSEYLCSIHSCFQHMILKVSFPNNCHPHFFRYYNLYRAAVLLRRMIYLGELEDVTHLPVIIPYISSNVNFRLHKLILSNLRTMLADGWGDSWRTHMVLSCKYIVSKKFKTMLLDVLKDYSLCSEKAWTRLYKK